MVLTGSQTNTLNSGAKANDTIISNLTSVSADVTSVSQDVTDVKTDVAGVKTDVAGVKTDVASVSQDVADVKTDVAGVKTDVADVKTDVANLGNSIVSFTNSFEKIGHRGYIKATMAGADLSPVSYFKSGGNSIDPNDAAFEGLRAARQIEPAGYVGGILKAIAIVIFGTWQGKIELIMSSVASRFEQVYNDAADISLHFVTETTGRSVHGSTFSAPISGTSFFTKYDFSSPYLTVKPSIGVVKYHDAAGGSGSAPSQLGLYDQLVQMATEKIAAFAAAGLPAPTEFRLGSDPNCTAEYTINTAVSLFATAFQAGTGLALVADTSGPAGNIVTITGGVIQSLPTNPVDAYATDDWVVNYGFYGDLLALNGTPPPQLDINDNYGVIMKHGQNNSDLLNAVETALSTLSNLDTYDVNTPGTYTTALAASPPLAQAVGMDKGMNSPFTGAAAIGQTTVADVGSLQSLVAEVLADSRFPTFDTTSVTSGAKTPIVN
jgi:ABC-type amino acid transport substrate-binding protein